MKPEIGKRTLNSKLDHPIYLNYAAVSPPLDPVQKAVNACLADYSRHGVSAVMDWVEERESLRRSLCEFFAANAPEEFALVPNTSSGVVAIANSVDWSPGDQVVLFDQEFPTNIIPWQRAADTYGLEIVWASVTETLETRARNLDALGERVRMIAVSATQFQTGWSMPVRAIADRAHAVGAQVFVDGIQACGVCPVDFRQWDADYVACGGHKWMMGLEGAGFLWIHRRCWEALIPRLGGWLSVEDPLQFLFEGPGHLRYDRPIKKTPDFLEFGATNALGYAGLHAALKVLIELGIESIWQHVSAYLDLLETGFAERSYPTTRLESAHSGILSIRPPESRTAAEVAEHFASYGIAVSTPDGYVRFAPHWPNSLDEVDTILQVFDQLPTNG